MQKSKLLAYAVVLLALAHPALVPPVLGVIGLAATAALVAVGWFLTNLSLTLTIAATVLLARAFPGTFGHSVRWIGRALVVSVASVSPKAA